MAPLDDQRRQKSQHVLLRAVDQEACLERLPDDLLAGHCKFDSKDQAVAPHRSYHRQLVLQLLQLLAEVSTNLAHMLEEARPLQDLQHLQPQPALQRPASERGTVHAG